MRDATPWYALDTHVGAYHEERPPCIARSMFDCTLCRVSLLPRSPASCPSTRCPLRFLLASLPRGPRVRLAISNRTSPGTSFARRHAQRPRSARRSRGRVAEGASYFRFVKANSCSVINSVALEASSARCMPRHRRLPRQRDRSFFAASPRDG